MAVKKIENRSTFDEVMTTTRWRIFESRCIAIGSTYMKLGLDSFSAAFQFSDVVIIRNVRETQRRRTAGATEAFAPAMPKARGRK